MTARFLFVMLAVSLASLTPIVPGALVPSAQPKSRCCADMNAIAGQRCPLNQTGTNSTSTCCVSPSACVPFHVSNEDGFGPRSEVIGAIFVSNDHFSVRTQRPPVPPPRGSIF